MTEPDRTLRDRIWNGPIGRIVCPILAIVSTVAIPGVGALGAFALAFFAILVGLRPGSLRDIGMRPPASWPKLLATTLVIGFSVQLFGMILLEPLLGRLTGAPVDVSNLDPIRGNVANFLIVLAIGWIIGGVLEEITFRGFIMTQIRRALGGGKVATAVAMLACAVPFGLAHMYQGWAGVISTGLLGLFFAVLFVYFEDSLWHAILTHGWVNTLGITLIYLDVDHVLNNLLF